MNPSVMTTPCRPKTTGCLEWRDATAALSAQVILIVAASLALGVALLKTGAADYLARLFVALVGDASPRFVVSGLMLLIGIHASPANVMGILSLMFWALVMIVGLKYLIFVFRADNR